MAVLNGFNNLLYANSEGTFRQGPGSGSTAGVFANADAMRFIEASFGSAQKQRTRHRKDKTGTRSPSTELVHGAYDPVEGITIRRSIANSGTNTTPPDTTALMANAFGNETVGGSDVTYSISEDPTDSIALMMAHQDGDYAEWIYGGVVTQWSMNFEQEEPEEVFTIKGAQRSTMNRTTLNGSIDGTTQTITLNNPNRISNPFGIVIQIESEEILTSSDPDDWDPSAGTLSNCTRGHNSTSNTSHTDSTTVDPAIPGGTNTAGSPIGEHDITFSWAGVAFDVLSGEVTFSTGRDLRALERGNYFSAGLVNRPLEVSCTSRSFLFDGSNSFLGDTSSNQSGAVVYTLGSSGGSIYTVTVAAAEISTAEPEYPQEGLYEVEVNWMPYGSSGNDDINVVTS